MSIIDARHTSPVEVDALAGALTDGKLRLAGRILRKMPKALPDQALIPAADYYMRRQRWADAARVLSRVINRDTYTQMNRTLAMNFAALQIHQPDVYSTIIRCRNNNSTYTIIPGRGGHATIRMTDSQDKRIFLSPHNDPVKGVDTAITQINQLDDADQSIGLFGIGDGYLLNSLANNPPQLFLNKQQCVFIFEPDARLVRMTMMIHDYTGPNGPIEQKRFQWFVGRVWHKNFRRTILNDLQLPLPRTTITQSPDYKQITTEITAIADDYNAADQQRRQSIEAHYAKLSRDKLARLFSDNPPRTPRIMLITSRFSTVLQYSTTDAAEGFRELGWNARVMIEPSDYHRDPPQAIRKELHQFKPDLVFKINHLRHEHPDVFPPDVPYICWIQDHLPHLINDDLSDHITTRDYILTDSMPMYTGVYTYPLRQVIDQSKLSRPQMLPKTWSCDAGDLVFTSNASDLPQKIADELVTIFQSHSSDLPLVRDVCNSLIQHYEQGNTIFTRYHLRRFMLSIEKKRQQYIVNGIVRDRFLSLLFDRLNNLLYRQQTLRWIADVARKHNLIFSLYGMGWENHPDFAPYAKGVLQYGPELEKITRRTKITFQIVPYSALNQRLFDGLLAGGFVLIRQHPLDVALPQFADFIDQRLNTDIDNVSDAIASLDNKRRTELTQIIDQNPFMGDYGDPIALVRSWRRAGLLTDGQPLLPRIDEVSFNNQASLQSLITHFVANENARRDIAKQQRQCIEQHFTYAIGMKRVIRKIHNLLTTESD